MDYINVFIEKETLLVIRHALIYYQSTMHLNRPSSTYTKREYDMINDILKDINREISLFDDTIKKQISIDDYMKGGKET